MKEEVEGMVKEEVAGVVKEEVVRVVKEIVAALLFASLQPARTIALASLSVVA